MDAEGNTNKQQYILVEKKPKQPIYPNIYPNN